MPIFGLYAHLDQLDLYKIGTLRIIVNLMLLIFLVSLLIVKL
jgi:hypothetical protein